MIYLKYKKYKEKYKTSMFENAELKKSNDIMGKKIHSGREFDPN